MDISPEEWFEVKGITKNLKDHVLGNGKPALEVRLREYVDQRDNHKERQTQQEIMDLKAEVDAKHRENTTKLDKLADKHDVTQRLVYIGTGIMVALEALGLFKK